VQEGCGSEKRVEAGEVWNGEMVTDDDASGMG
jgi:hypothetical protein